MSVRVFTQAGFIRSVCFLWLLLLVPVPTLAGHGFMTAFANIEWLPDPGRTPDSAWYRLDAWQEETKLWLARSPEAKVQICLAFAREPLAARNFQEELRLHCSAALNVGATKDEVAEVIFQMATYGGVPCMVEGLKT